uniref:Uncharacterized protein n=1 Tax=Photinus pyralis TaxID=7054 RepID=A0A1Y1K4V1_PHOPY
MASLSAVVKCSTRPGRTAAHCRSTNIWIVILMVYMKDQVVDHLSTAIEPCAYLSPWFSKLYGDFFSQCPPANPATANKVTNHIKGKKMGIDMARNQPGKTKKRRRRAIRPKQQGFT